MSVAGKYLIWLRFNPLLSACQAVCPHSANFHEIKLREVCEELAQHGIDRSELFRELRHTFSGHYCEMEVIRAIQLISNESVVREPMHGIVLVA